MRALLLLLALALATVPAACDGDAGEGGRSGGDATDATTTGAGGDSAGRTGDLPPAPRVETVARDLEAPWEIAFLPDGRALVTERPGRVRLIDADGRLRERPVATIDVTSQGEGGLLGLALDPDFADNRLVYLYLTAGDAMEVVRYRLADRSLIRQASLVDGIRAGVIHDSGRIRFGPDDRLYVATGDAGIAELAQDRDSLNGKFLRLTPEQYRGDGGRPEILTLGHRNPQGFDWQPGSGRLIATEHGQQALDEVNEIEQGSNYGWPVVEGADHGDFTAPVTVYRETIAPSGATFVTREGSDWTGDYLFAGLASEQIRRIRLDGDRVTVDEALLEGRFGRLRTVAEGPDGALYALTSNRDGRGSPRPGDDRVLRILPPGEGD
ncbi:MAG: PQQ-dependent sugar dehydrogenase [Thermoleophilaceae bacterium]